MGIESALQLTHVSLLKKQAELYGDKPLYYFEDRKVEYNEFDHKTDIIAKGLEKIGVERGDRVGILLPNGNEVLESYYGIWKNGGISVSLNPMYTGKEIEYIINNAEAKYLITSDFFRSRLEAVRPNMPSLEGVIMVTPDPTPDSIPYADITSGSERIGDKGILPDHPAQIMYTSGTTGKPKGAVLPHNGVIAASSATPNLGYFGPDDSTVCALPLFHLFAVVVFASHLYAGGKGIIIHERFDAEAVLQDFGKYGTSIFFGVPTMYSFLLDSYDPLRHNVDKMRLGIVGAAPVPVHVMREIEKEFRMTIIEVFGQTESCGGGAIERLEMERKIGSCGIAIPGLELKIVDENDNELIPGELGEIVMRGPMQMKGYWNMPRANQETLRNGWLHSGDMGRMDEEGYVYIVDRLKDMIITSGFNVYPKEIEDVIYSHPAVLEATVVGAPDATKGELAKAFVVVKEGSSVTEEELNAFCRERLAAYKTPRIYEFRDSLPKSPQGKILKRVLRDEMKTES